MKFTSHRGPTRAAASPPAAARFRSAWPAARHAAARLRPARSAATVPSRIARTTSLKRPSTAVLARSYSSLTLSTASRQAAVKAPPAQAKVPKPAYPMCNIGAGEGRSCPFDPPELRPAAEAAGRGVAPPSTPTRAIRWRRSRSTFASAPFAAAPARTALRRRRPCCARALAPPLRLGGGTVPAREAGGSRGA